MTSKKPRIFSGIQPTGIATLGNYVGAIRNWLNLINDYECIFGVVNLHSITVRYKPEELLQRTYDMVRVLISCGLTPDKCHLIIQGDVPEHSELCWLLSSVSMMGELERMTQFKDKSNLDRDNINAGLFTYPILMAADILLYEAEAVPVGEDQVQHLEFARDLAKRFNHRYSDTFIEPKAVLAPVARVIGLDGQGKMSKSKDESTWIGLIEPQDSIEKKLKKAITDPERKRGNDPGDPVNRCLSIFPLHKVFSSAEMLTTIETQCQTAELGCGDCKNLLAKQIQNEIDPIRQKYAELGSKNSEIEDILQSGLSFARPIAQNTLKKVRQKMGIEKKNP